MAQFASADELATLLRSSFSAAEFSAADLLLEGISSAMQRAAGGQRLELVTDDVVKLQGTWGRELVLPQWPVVAVSSVKLNGTPIPPGTWFLTGTGKLFRGYLPIFNGPSDWGGDLFLSSWGGPVAEVEVTYTHGLDPLPADIKLICLSAARRSWSNPNARITDASGFPSVQASIPSPEPVLSQSEKEALAEYRRDR